MYWNTVNENLRSVLRDIMHEPKFDAFRLVGGTALSLQWGHRMSVDIDIFSDQTYGSIDFATLGRWFQNRFEYVDVHNFESSTLGKSLFIGHHSHDAIKVDIYHCDRFIRPALVEDGIRMASEQDIIAMKLDIIGRNQRQGGRKKDFWDLHHAQDFFSLDIMIDFYHERYPYGHSTVELLNGLISFSYADEDFEPICMHGKHWELIKNDFEYWVSLMDK
jgi:hypothetical protein